MKREMHDLIEAVRTLGVELTGKPSPRCIRIKGDTGDFADKLKKLQEALEALDASEANASTTDSSPNDGSSDPKKLRAALDGLLRFIQVKGDFLSEADAIVREALELEQTENTKASSGLPTFRPSNMKKKRGSYKPRLNIMPDRPGEASLNDLKKIVHELNATNRLLGSTVAQPIAAHERSMKKSFFKGPSM